MDADGGDSRLRCLFIKGIYELLIIEPPWVSRSLRLQWVADRVALGGQSPPLIKNVRSCLIATILTPGSHGAPSPFDLYAYEEGIDLPEIVSWGGRSDLTSSVADDLLSLWDRGSGPRGREEPCWHALMPSRRVEFRDNAQASILPSLTLTQRLSRRRLAQCPP